MKKQTRKQVKVTQHAFERFIMRVGKEGTPPSKIKNMDAVFWCTHAIMNGEDLGKFPDGKKHYAYKGHVLIVDERENAVITINPYQPYLDDDSNFNEVNQAAIALVEKHLLKTLKPLHKKHRELQIEMYEEKIKRLKVFNPKTQESISKKITKITEQVRDIENQIEGALKVAEQYGVEI